MTDDLVTACPRCDATRILSIVGSGNSTDRPRDHGWRCRECGHRFDEPVHRDRRHAWSPGSSLIAELDALDPDDVGGESA